jgi:hypothetical protein
VVTTIFSKVPVCPIESLPDDSGVEFVEGFPKSKSAIKPPETFPSMGMTLKWRFMRRRGLA